MGADKNVRVAVVTGGGRGFGKALGAALARQGLFVALVDRDGGAAESAAREIGALATPFAADIGRRRRAGYRGSHALPDLAARALRHGRDAARHRRLRRGNLTRRRGIAP